MQSEPVSPPPMTMTFLPAAQIFCFLACSAATSASPQLARLDCGRNSIAKWTPSSSRPGTGRSRPASAPVEMTTAS